MKTLIFSTIVLLSASFSVKADYNKFNNNFTTVHDSAKQSSLPQLLTLYFELKDALVNSDPAMASTHAALLLKAIDGVDIGSLSESERKTFVSLQPKLAYDARHISEVQKIDHQREHFASLSLNMYTLAKVAKLSNKPVYQEYCPMKKTYWLSSETAIKNPYFGKQMLTCGSVTNTIK